MEQFQMICDKISEYKNVKNHSDEGTVLWHFMDQLLYIFKSPLIKVIKPKRRGAHKLTLDEKQEKETMRALNSNTLESKKKRHEYRANCKMEDIVYEKKLSDAI